MTNIGELSVGVKVDQGTLKAMTATVQSEAKKQGEALEKGIGGGAKAGFTQAEKAASSFNETLKTIGKTILSVFAVQQILSFAKGIVILASNLEQAKISFTTMLGSAQAAGKMLKDLSDFAKQTPFELVGIRENAKQLLAMGVAQENIIPTMKALGDVSAGLSVPLERLSLAYGQVLSKGKLQGDDLKQFTEAGVPLLATLATQLGKTSGEITKMIENGQISAVEVTKAFQTMSGEGGKFANLMDAQSKTVAGRFSNLKDSINSLGEVIGAKFLPSLGNAIDGMLVAVNQYGDSVGTIMVDTVNALIGIFGTAISGFIDLYNQLSGNTSKAEKGQITFGKVVLMVFNFVTSGLEALLLVFKSAGGLIGLVIYDIGQRFSLLGQVVGSFSSQVGSMMKVVGNNIGVAFMAGINVALEGINLMIEQLNKIPGVSIGTIGQVGGGGSLMEFAQWTDPMDNFKAKSDAITSELKSGFNDFTTGVEKDFGSMAEKMTARTDEILNSTKKTADAVKKIPPIDLSKILPTGSPADAKAGKKATEEITYELGKLKDAYTKLKATKKEMGDNDKKYSEMNLKRLADGKKALNEIGDKIKQNEKAYTDSIKKISEESTKKNEEATGNYIRDQAVRQADVEKQLKDLDDQIAKERLIAAAKGQQIDNESLIKQKKIQDDISEAKLRQSEQTSKTSASEKLSLSNRILELQAQFEQLKIAKDYDENTSKLLEYEQRRTELNQQLTDTKSNIANLSTTEAVNMTSILETERARAALSDTKKAEFDYQAKLKAIADTKKAEEDAAKAKFDQDQKALERQKAIYEFFQNKTSFTPIALKNLEKTDFFKNSSGEDQNLMIKLATELIALTQQKNKKFDLEKQLAEETIKLQDAVNQNAIANVQKLKKEYQDLIAEINAAILAQSQLSFGTNIARGFADGGYTGDGGVHDVAGVVHKGEYVVSQNMLGKLPGIIPALEAVRSGNTFDQSRSVAINGPITMNEAIDFEIMLRKAKFLM